MELVLIGGPQSTGSSLLRQILNRHDQIHCLNETHLFAKELMYGDWSSAKQKLNIKRRQGLKTAGWHIFTGFDIDKQQKKIWLKNKDEGHYQSFESLIKHIRSELKLTENTVLMDKTPANVFTIQKAFKAGICSKAIVTVRNPYDTIASLVSRGKHLMDAVVLVKSAYIEMAELIDDKSVYFVKYEDLVSRPDDTMNKLFEFLELPYKPSVLIPKDASQEQDTQIEGWSFDESSEIQKAPIGRFDGLDRKKQNLIIRAFNMISWKGNNKAIEEIMAYCDYHEKFNEDQVRVSFGYHLFKTLIKHWIKNNPYHILNNPITFAKNH